MVVYKNSRGVTYYLNQKIAFLRSKRGQVIYWFSKTADAKTAIDHMPAGYEVGESPKSKMPYLRKVKD